MSRQALLSAILIAFVFGVLMLLIGLRVHAVDIVSGSYIACPGCFDLAVVQADLVLFSLLAAILLLAGLLRSENLARIVHTLIGIVFLIYICDLLIARLFGIRLFLSDASLFINEPAAVWNQFSTGLGWVAYAVIAAILVAFVVPAWLPAVRSKPQRLFLLAVFVLSLSAMGAGSQQPYVNAWAVNNVFAANIATSESTRYSASEANRIQALPSPSLTINNVTAPAPSRPQNIILLMVESWSAWHSDLFGGYENWTPQLDAAARSGLRFENFHSIGFATVHGLVGILAGQQLWSPFLHRFRSPPFHSMWGVERTLPKMFSQQGYASAFLTSGPLGLTSKGDWLSDLGYTQVEGNEHPYYADLPRYAFGSATDQALYGRALQWMDSAKSPWFLTLETVSSHQPYIDPETGTQSLELAMKYTDNAFGEFFQRLQENGYFEDGILVVASDHRSMTPIPAHEIERFGGLSNSRVPAFVVGGEFQPGTVDSQVYSQSDLLPSLEFWLSGQTSIAQQQALMLTAEEFGDIKGWPLSCAYHGRGDLRGIVDVVCNLGQGQLRLDGDQTRFLSSTGFDSQQQKQILDRTARLRLEGLHRDKRWQEQQAAQ